MDAYLTARSASVEAALAKLGDATDPETIRHRLSVLLDAEEHAQAVEVVRGRAFHQRWCEFAVTALVSVAQYDLARQIIEWTVQLPDASVRRRCILRYAEARYAAAFRGRSLGSPVFPGELAAEEEQGLQDVLGVLEPLLLVVRGNRRVESELESAALQLAIRAHACLCNLTAAEELANLLMSRTPVPLELAELVLGGWVSTSDNLAAKIRADHRGSTKASVLAALIDGEVHGKPEDAFDAVENLENDATTQEEKESLCRAAVQLGLRVGPEETVRARETIMNLLGADHLLVLECDVALCLREGEHEKARDLLESNRDERSFIWLQMYAHYHESIGDQKGALDYYEKASRLIPHPKVLETVAFMGFQQGRFRIVSKALETKLRQQPDHALTRKNLAITYARLHEYAKAATHFAALRELGSASLDDNLDYAGCLTHSGAPEKALEVYEELCSLDEPPVSAIVSRAHVLKSLNRPTDAFASLHETRADYWDEPEFVAVYWDAASAADEDRNAHQALERLLQLQQEGLTEQQYLRPATCKDLEEHVEDFRKRRKLGFEQLIRGRLPWLLVDTALGSEPYWGWRVRTQEMP
ncbi:MAG: tetratricopeptide repeat protein, partial [Planctomycetota bacterium]